MNIILDSKNTNPLSWFVRQPCIPVIVVTSSRCSCKSGYCHHHHYHFPLMHPRRGQTFDLWDDPHSFHFRFICGDSLRGEYTKNGDNYEDLRPRVSEWVCDKRIWPLKWYSLAHRNHDHHRRRSRIRTGHPGHFSLLPLFFCVSVLLGHEKTYACIPEIVTELPCCRRRWRRSIPSFLLNWSETMRCYGTKRTPEKMCIQNGLLLGDGREWMMIIIVVSLWSAVIHHIAAATRPTPAAPVAVVSMAISLILIGVWHLNWHPQHTPNIE